MIDRPSSDLSPAQTRLRILFIMYNMVLWTTGLILLWFGVWLEVEFSRYISGEAQLISFFLLGMGSVLVLFNSIACFCALKGETAILNLYGLVLGVVFIIEVLLSVMMVALKRSLLSKFNGQELRRGDPSIDMTLIQSTFECCGLSRGYLDYYTAQAFVPRSCCLPDLPRCHPSNEAHLFTRNCYKELESFINSNIGTMSLLAMCFAAVTLIGVVSSFSWAKKATYEEIQDRGEEEPRRRPIGKVRFEETER